MRPKKITEEDLLNYAVDLTEANGFECLSLHKLSDKLGIKPASLYNHITGLGDLKGRLGAEALRNFAALVREKVAGTSGKEGLETFADCYISYAKEHPEMFLAMVSLPEQKSGNAELYDAEVRSVFTRMMECFHLPKTELSSIYATLKSLARGFYLLNRSAGGKEQSEQRNREAFRYTIALLCNYLDNRGAQN